MRHDGAHVKGNRNEIASLLKQVQSVQAKAVKIQEDLSRRTFTGTAGGGAVSVEVTGGLEVRKVSITPEVLEAGDRETIEAAVAAAANIALREAQETVSREMGRTMEGLPIPGLVR